LPKRARSSLIHVNDSAQARRYDSFILKEMRMQVPLRITFQDMPVSPAVEAQIRKRVEALEKLSPNIVSCRVAVESSAHRHRQGKMYHLHVELTVPGREIVVKRDPPEHHAHEDVLVAVRDAFDAVRRQLEDHARRVRVDTKTHETPLHGRVTQLFPDFGFIESSDGQQIYMHRNAVIDRKYDALSVGDEVRYVLHEGEGEKGPQASTVVPIGKHHLDPARP
jgi:cold shock CspA family protein/ribosome-associated translation inhibitor RaiA